MENEKLVLNVEGNEITIREGKAPNLLEPKEPLKLHIEGTIETVYEFLSKRLDSGQFNQQDCHIEVSREDKGIALYINERDAYKHGLVAGCLEIHPDMELLGINLGKMWSPSELAMVFKMNRRLFADRAENMRLVSTLMNYTADINAKVERAIQENGSKTDNYSQVVNSNLPEAFTLNMRIFKGGAITAVEVETIATVVNREVSFVLISPGAKEIHDREVDFAIDEQIEKIRELAPEIAIIEK